MPSYILILDLKQTSAAPYSKLSELLTGRLYGHWVKGTTWVVDVRQGPTELETYLSQYLQGDETACVAELTRGHPFCRLPALAEWINRHPPLR